MGSPEGLGALPMGSPKGLDYEEDWSTTSRTSPALVSDDFDSPAASSMTAKDPRAPAIRRAGTAGRTLSTRPFRATNKMSMLNRIANVWTSVPGAMIRAWPGASESRPSSPRFLDAESKAVSTTVATGLPVRVFRKVAAGRPRRSDSRKCGLLKTKVPAARNMSGKRPRSPVAGRRLSRQ